MSTTDLTLTPAPSQNRPRGVRPTSKGAPMPEQSLAPETGAKSPLFSATSKEPGYGVAFWDSVASSFNRDQHETTLGHSRDLNTVYDNYLKELSDGGVDVSGIQQPYKRNIDEFSLTEDQAVQQFHNQVDKRIQAMGPHYTGPYKTHDDLIEELQANKEADRQAAETAKDAAGPLGGVANLIGSIGGFMHDPMNYYTLPLGFAGQGASWAMRILNTALNEARIAILSETAIQAGVQGTKPKVGEKPDAAQAVEAIGSAGAGAFILGGIFKGAGEVLFPNKIPSVDEILRAVKELPPEHVTEDVHLATKILEAESTAEAGNPYIGEAGKVEHRENLGKVARSIANGEPVAPIGPNRNPIKAIPADQTAEHVAQLDIPEGVKDAITSGQVLREAMRATDLPEIGNAVHVKPVEPASPNHYYFKMDSYEVDDLGMSQVIRPRPFVGDHPLGKALNGVPLSERLIVDTSKLDEVFLFRLKKDLVEATKGEHGEVYTPDPIPVEKLEYMDGDGTWRPMVDKERNANIKELFSQANPAVLDRPAFIDLGNDQFTDIDLVRRMGDEFHRISNEFGPHARLSLADMGFLSKEIEALNKAGLAHNGYMDTLQYQTWLEIRQARLKSLAETKTKIEDGPPPEDDPFGPGTASAARMSEEESITRASRIEQLKAQRVGDIDEKVSKMDPRTEVWLGDKDGVGPHRLDETVSTIEKDSRSYIDIEMERIKGENPGMTPEVLAEHRKRFELQSVKNADLREKLTKTQAVKQAEVDERFAKFADNPGEVALSFLQFSRIRKVYGHSWLQRYNELYNTVGSRMIEMIDDLRSKDAGVKEVFTTERGKEQTSLLTDFVKAGFGEAGVDPKAKRWYDSYRAARDDLLDRAEIAGMEMKRRADGALPQKHNVQAMKHALDPQRWWRRGRFNIKAAKAKWLDDIASPGAERVAMYDVAGQPMNNKDLREALGTIFDDMMTDGASRAGERVTGSPVYKRLSNRDISFKSAEDWIYYHDKYNGGDIFTELLADLDSLAKDVATVEILGPYPDATIAYIKKKTAEAYAANPEAGRAAWLSKYGLDILDNMWAVINGTTSDPVSGWMANTGHMIRTLQSGALLSSATISALPDQATIRSAMAVNGIPWRKEVFSLSTIRHMGSSEKKLVAAQMGYMMDGWMSHNLAAYRTMGSALEHGNKWVDRAADTMLRASLLSSLTDSNRQLFRMSFLSELTRLAKGNTAWDKMPELLRKSMDAYGITRQDWVMYKRVQDFVAVRPGTDVEIGAAFKRPQDIYEQALTRTDISVEQLAQRLDTASKFADMIDSEVYRAVTIPDLRTQAALTRGTRPGTLSGEALRMFAQFKSFPVAVVGLQLTRGFMDKSISRTKFLAGLFLGMYTAGLVGVQVKEVLKGKEPYKITDPELHMKAFMLAGLMGLIGDAAVGMFGNLAKGKPMRADTFQNVVIDMLGPTAGAAENAVKLGANPSAGRAIDFIRQFTPGQSMWYARLVMERMLWDQIENEIDGYDARERWRKAEQRMYNENHRHSWWKRGRTLPEFAR